MTSQILIKRNISLRKMLPLTRDDNILINRNTTLKTCHRMLLRRLEHTPGTAIYAKPHLLSSDPRQYFDYLGDGSQLILWTDGSIDTRKPKKNVTLVHTTPTNPIQQEGFLIIRMGDLSRLLLVWQERSSVEGVLVTNAQLVKEIIRELEMIISDYS